MPSVELLGHDQAGGHGGVVVVQNYQGRLWCIGRLRLPSLMDSLSIYRFPRNLITRIEQVFELAVRSTITTSVAERTELP